MKNISLRRTKGEKKLEKFAEVQENLEKKVDKIEIKRKENLKKG